MDTVEVIFGPPLDQRLAGELRSRILFVDDRIGDFDLVVDEGGLRAAVLRGVDLGDPTVLDRKVRLLVEREIRPQVPVAAKVLWRSHHTRRPAGDVFDALTDAGFAHVQGEGQVALSGLPLELVGVLDHLLMGRLRARFDVTEYAYPTLIRSDTLRVAGYFDSFPHHLMFVTRLHSDLDVYRAFEVEVRAGTDAAGLLGLCRNVDYCLPPTMCYHTFAQHRGRSISGRLRVVAARGKSFRHEAGYHTTLARLWDFTIREMVFLGAREEVTAARQQMIESLQGLVDELGLDAWLEVANDPFFGSDAVPDAIGSQRLLELKYELRMPISVETDIAVGSLNFHDDVFGTRFEITGDDGAPIRSGCIGFGLERLVFAVMSQCGIDPAGWPEPLARAHRALTTSG